MRATAVVTFIFAATALLGGCATEIVADPYLSFEAPGPIAVRVDSFAGDVSIEADPELPAASVRVIRKATQGFSRRQQARASLPEIEYTVEMVQTRLGPELQVRTTTAYAEPHFHRAEILITAPQIDGVTVHTARGNVEAIGIGGKVDIITNNGEVRLFTEQPMIRDVTVLNQFGDINYRVRGESTGDLDCESIGGSVRYRLKQAKAVVHQGTDHDTLLANFNDGTNPITLRTVDGTIRVAVVENPQDTGPFFIDGWGLRQIPALKKEKDENE